MPNDEMDLLPFTTILSSSEQPLVPVLDDMSNKYVGHTFVDAQLMVQNMGFRAHYCRVILLEVPLKYRLWHRCK